MFVLSIARCFIAFLWRLFQFVCFQLLVIIWIPKMNRRNKRTSYYQYEVYLDFMEENPPMSANKLSRTQDGKKWKELSDLLNKCSTGPTLSPEEWRKVCCNQLGIECTSPQCVMLIAPQRLEEQHALQIPTQHQLG